MRQPAPASAFDAASHPAQASYCAGLGDTRARRLFASAERRERLMAAADEDAERERRRAADAVLTMDQHPLAAIEMAIGEGDALAKHCRRDGAVVLGRQMQEREPVALEHDGVVAGLDPQVDDGLDPQLARQNLRVGGPEAAADREVVGDPAQVQRRRHHGMRPHRPGGPRREPIRARPQAPPPPICPDCSPAPAPLRCRRQTSGSSP